MENTTLRDGLRDGPRGEVDDILASLRQGLEKAEEALSAILAGVASGNQATMAELEAALSDMEATLDPE